MIEAMSIYDYVPSTLSWDDADPRRHAFDSSEARAIIAGMTPELPGRRQREAWQEAVTQALAVRFGRWTWGWAWGRDESDLGGGPVGSWCCLVDSIGTAEQTTERAHEALCEWRRWLEKLAALFDTLTLPAGPSHERLAAWERAVTVLVTEVVEQTDAGDAWYEHCAQVLDWFLAHHQVPAANRGGLVEDAIGGRFESWEAPRPELVTEIGHRIATAVEGPTANA
jgi:hypothetical protein